MTDPFTFDPSLVFIGYWKDGLCRLEYPLPDGSSVSSPVFPLVSATFDVSKINPFFHRKLLEAVAAAQREGGV